jgi:hypothetical protein
VNFQTNIAREMDVIVNDRIVNGILPKVSGIRDTLPSDLFGGIAGAEFYNEVLGILETNNRELGRLREEIRLGIAPPTAPERVEELELHNADILVKVAGKVSEAMVEAEKTGQPISSGDLKMSNIIKANAIEIENPNARGALKTGIETTLRDHADSATVKRSFENIPRIF